MPKAIFAIWLRSLSELPRLKPEYQRLSRYLGYGSVGLGLVVVLPVMYYSRSWLGLPMGEASLDGLRLLFFIWIAVCIMAIPYALYAGTVVIYGAFSLAMLTLGKFSAGQARAFAFSAAPPGHWFADHA